MTKYASGFITNARNRSLFYSVIGPNKKDGEAWIFCPPLFEEAIIAHDVLRNFARALAEIGTTVYRFDYEGQGDSAGTSTDVDLHGWVSDTLCMVQHAKKAGATGIILLGIRGGALIAAQAAALLGPACTKLVNLCPTLSGRDHLLELLRINLTAQIAVHGKVLRDRETILKEAQSGKAVNISGWEVGPRLLLDLAAADCGASTSRLPCIQKTILLAPGCSPFWLDPKKVDLDQQPLAAALLAEAGGSHP